MPNQDVTVTPKPSLFAEHRTEIGLSVVCLGVGCIHWQAGIVLAGVSLLIPDILAIANRLLAKRK